MSLRIGIDTGGTFTDVVAVRGAGEHQQVVTTKTPSTPEDPAVAVMTGLAKVLAVLDTAPAEVASVSHGTTVATNALLQEDLGRLGLLVTEGYRHILEIARQSVPDGYGNSYFWTKPDRVVPLHLVAEVPERLDHRGEVVRPLDVDAVRTAVAGLRDAGVEAVAVSLLHGHANPVHEQVVAEVIAEVHPSCTVSLSSVVLREYREYERTLATAVDAAVKPRMAAYLSAVADRLAELTPAPLRIMTSSGGVASAARAAARPVATLLSGPAAGAVGAAVVAGWAGHDDVLTLDGGGTSTDVGVVHDGRPSVTTEGRVGRFALRVPMVDVVTVGTGGGSVGWASPEGRLRVGPRSAGASPGPLCYGQGGTEPTVTDAHLVLGRIPAHLLGGEIPLDTDAAATGIDRLGRLLGLDRESCAAGMLEIAAWNQANAIRQVTVRRGVDLRNLTLVAFGGSGPLQACRLVDLLGLPGALVPVDPGNVSAFGLLAVDVRGDEVQTHVVAADRIDLPAMTAVYRDLTRRVTDALRADGFAPGEVRLQRSADLRYHGQAAEVTVDVPDGPVDEAFARRAAAAFHDAHEQRYGYAYRDDPAHRVEWVNLRITGIGPTPMPAPTPVGRAAGPAAVGGWRRVHQQGAWHDTALVDRAGLRAGHRVVGPAVVEEFGSTTPVPPGFVADVDDHGNLRLGRAEATASQPDQAVAS